MKTLRNGIMCMAIAALALSFSSCGKDKTKEMETDVTDLCKSFKEAKADSTGKKYVDWMKKAEEVRNKYKDDMKIGPEFDKKMAECTK